MKPLSLILLIFLSIFSSLANGQLPKQSTQAPNAWMKIPSPPARDAVSASTRDQRNRYWDNQSPVLRGDVLTAESAHHFFKSEDGGVNGPEIRELLNRGVLIGTFLTYQSILTPSRRTVYTDVTFRVHQVFQDQRGRATPNSDITVSLLGGTVLQPSGEPISFLTHPRELSLQPNRPYLLLLTYNPDGDFYLPVDNWDLSDGFARPNTGVSQAKAKEGTSISGMTVEALIHTLNERLSGKR